MHPMLIKSFGGLSKQYYFRQLFFGSLIGAFMIFAPSSIQFNHVLFAIASTLLYPYSRFVYESAIGFVVGNNFFIANAILVLGVKFVTMLVCWATAIFIAPIGLLYLLFYHSKAR